MAAISSTGNFGGGKETFKATTYTGSIYDAFKGIDSRLLNMVLSGIAQMRVAAEQLSNIGFNETKLLIGKKGSYKKYYKKGVERMSSAPGTPPAAQRGEELEPSIYQKVTSKKNQNPATAEFGSTASFARTLEYGSTTMPARPFMLPARAKVMNRAPDIVVRNILIAYNRSLKKSTGKKAIVVDMRG